jgi:hypothetical protein
MKSIITALGLAFVLAVPANAATADPEVIIYRFPGVKDDGGASTQNHECVTGEERGYVTQMTHHFCPAPESRICKSGY